MIWVFGSGHYDTTEKKELEKLLQRISESNGMVLIELSTDGKTVALLKRFRSLNDDEIDTMLKLQFGRRAYATYNLLKMIQGNYFGIKRLVPIEPKCDYKMKLLDNNLGSAYNEFSSTLSYALKHNDKGGVTTMLLEKFFNFEKKSNEQCMFREKTMLRKLLRAASSNCNPNVLYYSGYGHTAAIKESLRINGIRFRSRDNKYINYLEGNYFNLRKLVSSRATFGELNNEEILFFSKAMLFSIFTWDLMKDKATTALNDYKVYMRLERNIGSIADYEKSFKRLKSTTYA